MSSEQYFQPEIFQNMIDRHDEGNSSEYYKLLNIMRSYPPTANQLIILFHILDKNTPRLHYYRYRELIEILCSLNVWLLFSNEEDVHFMAQFFVGLIANHPLYTTPLFTSLILSLSPQVLKNDDGIIADPNYIMNNLTNFEKVKFLISFLIDNVPACTQTLVDTLRNPKNVALHPSSSCLRFCSYLLFTVRLSQIVDYNVNSGFTGDLLDYIFEKLSAIDSQIDMNDIIATSQQVPQEEGGYIFTKSPIVNKLDLSIYILLKYFNEQFYSPSQELRWPTVRLFYKRFFLANFDKYMLRNSIPNQIQFIMFYVCNLKKDLAIGFVDHLWKAIQDTKHGLYAPMHAITYLGDFVSRSKTIGSEIVIIVLQKLCNWMLDYLNSNETLACSFQKHNLFYCLFLSFVNICLFRQADIFDKPNILMEFKELKLKVILTSTLSPLRFCSADTLSQFETLLSCYKVGYYRSVFTACKCHALFTRSGQPTVNHAMKTPFSGYYLAMTNKFFIEPLIRQPQRASMLQIDTSTCKDAVGNTPMDIDECDMDVSVSNHDSTFILPFTNDNEKIFLGRKK